MLLLALPGLLAALAAASPCTFIHNVDFYIPNGHPSSTQPNASACCDFCTSGGGPRSPVLPPGGRPYTPFFTFNSNGNGCYCKPSQGERRTGPGLTSGACGPAPPPPPPAPPPGPNYQGCTTEAAKAQPYCNMSLSIDARVDSLVSALTLAEKATRMYSCVDQCDTCPCPVDRLGLPPFAYLLEANTGVAAKCLGPGRCATIFPGPLGMGGSFNRSVFRAKGRVLGREVRAFNNFQGTRNLGPMTGLAAFGPNINVARDPRFGRTSELPGEDPFLNGQVAVGYMRGIREKDPAGHPLAVAYLKHFTAYSRETNRGHDTYAISSFDFAETYLPQYEAALREGGPGSYFNATEAADGVMCSYNGENGAPSCANGWLLNKVMRETWKRPDAVVVTDSGAVLNLQGPPVNATSTAEAAAMAINNGTDMNDGHGFQALATAVAQGLTTEEKVDTALKRALRQLFSVGLFDQPSATDWTQTIKKDVINSPEHQAARDDAALQSIVLLQNDPLHPTLDASGSGSAGEAPLLPLAPGKKIAVLGPQAEARTGLLSDYAVEEACADGSDSCIVSIADAIKVANGGGDVNSSQGVEVNSLKRAGILPALAMARAADLVILALGIDKSIEGEGHDRPGIGLPGLQSEFAELVLALRKPTVLVLTNGGPLAIDNLVAHTRSYAPVRRQNAADGTGRTNTDDDDGHRDADGDGTDAVPPGPSAIVEAFNPNTNGATALAKLLFGENRWGKLPYTIYPASYARVQDAANFDMSKAPGRTYKYYTGEPLFAFGHGLSYATFSMDCARAEGEASGGLLRFGCAVRNTGAADGDEVVMVFHVAGEDVRARVRDAHPVPARSLVGFERARIAAGSVANLEFRLGEVALALVNATGGRQLYAGQHALVFSRGHGPEVAVNVTV